MNTVEKQMQVVKAALIKLQDEVTKVAHNTTNTNNAFIGGIFCERITETHKYLNNKYREFKDNSEPEEETFKKS